MGRTTIQELFKKASSEFKTIYFDFGTSRGKRYHRHESNSASTYSGEYADQFQSKTFFALVEKYNGTIKNIGQVEFSCPERDEMILEAAKMIDINRIDEIIPLVGVEEGKTVNEFHKVLKIRDYNVNFKNKSLTTENEFDRLFLTVRENH